MRPPPSRVGFGIDVHRIGGRPPVILGGVVVDERHGVVATSDGDVLAHAVIDALLGAAGLGDIGDHFPSSDPSWEGADSLVMLAQVVAAAAESGVKPVYVDATVVAEQIKVSPHRESIRTSLAAVLELEAPHVSVKATTTDGVGVMGSVEAIAVYAVVTAEVTS